MATSFSALNPTAGHLQSRPLPETLGHSRASLGKSLVESLLLFSGSWCTQGLFDFSECLWQVWCLILNLILPLLPSCRGFSFVLGCGVTPQSCSSVAQLLPQSRTDQESITTNKASGGDRIPVELFRILNDDAVKVLHSICQQIWKTQQWTQDWKR